MSLNFREKIRMTGRSVYQDKKKEKERKRKEIERCTGYRLSRNLVKL